MTHETGHILTTKRIIPLGTALAVFYWFFEAFVDSAFFHSASFMEELLHPDADELWMRLFIIALILAFSIYSHSMVADLTRTRNISLENEQMRRSLLNTTVEMAMLLTLDGTITTLNETAAAMFDKTADEVTGKNVFDLFSTDIASRRRAQYETVISTGQPVRLEDEVDDRWYDISIYPVLDISGNVSQLAIFSRDVTENKKMEQELTRLSITDDLTGLFNQRRFIEKIDEEVDRARRMNYPLCLVIFDVDNFKSYNDTYGHLEGNKILRNIGEITRRSIRKDVDSGYRYGGDEFALILPFADKKTAAGIIGRISKQTIEGTRGVNISYGIAAFTAEKNVNDLIHLADTLMYQHKEQIKDTRSRRMFDGDVPDSTA